MNHIYAPWRGGYFATKPTTCVFCDISSDQDSDQQNFVLFRDDIAFVVMNLYPYTPGHFMVIPHRHIDALENLPINEWLHISKLIYRGVELLKNEFGAKGVNVGANLGRAAGAGIEEHIHFHLVPRFPKDTNFITTIADARVYGVDFEEIYKKLLTKSREYFSKK